MHILDGLNPEQREAVEHITGPLLVVAGAGTGKTQVITRRIAHLIQTGNARPREVLALTFTEKAAREMADRLHGLIGWESFQVPVLTFNAFGAELLGRFATHAGRSVSGGLLNTTQKTLLLQQHIERIDFEYYGPQSNMYEFVEGFVGYIERLQNAGITSVAYRVYVDSLPVGEGAQHTGDVLEQHDLAAIYELYDAVKRETGTFDYNDQLALPLEILRQRPNLAERLTRQYKFILVDEYQDTSPVQDGLLRLLVPPGGNIFAVGDDDQAIYGFRGADIANILDFATHFQVHKPAVLIQNYRSGQPILDGAYRLIKHNDPDRLESRLHLNKQLIAQDSHAEVAFKPYRTVSDEKASVVEDIISRISEGTAPADIAILARSNATLKSIGKILRLRDIPFALSTEVNIFEQRELLNLWYLLEWIGSRVQAESVAHIVMGPFIGWTATEYRAVVRKMEQEMCTAEEALRMLALESERAKTLVASLDEWRSWSVEIPVSQLAYRLVFDTGLSDRLISRAGASPRIGQVFEDLHMLLNQMQDYETVAIDNTLVGYLASFPKPPSLEATEAVGDASGVQLLTVHASKGLEFDTVYVVGCTSKAWSERVNAGLEVPEELARVQELPPEHEQRRLMYVAATRAKRTLILSAATESAGGQRLSISPLVAELLGQELKLPVKEKRVESSDKLLQRLQQFYPLKSELSHQPLPFETSDGWIELAVGGLDTYRRCPHEFYLQYALGITQPFGVQLAFGTALHRAVQAYYEARLRNEPFSLKEALAYLDELWTDKGYESKGLADSARQKAHQTLTAFIEREDVLNRRILGSELKISLELPECKLRLRGRIDAYYETNDGIEIRDFKTGNKRDPDKLASDAKDNFQLRTYALAYEVMTGVAPGLVTLDYIVTGVEGSARLSPRILTNHRAKLAELAERIRMRDFVPAPPSEFHNCAAFTYYGDDEESI